MHKNITEIDIQPINGNAVVAAPLTARIGHGAWSSQFPQRSPQEISHIYGELARDTTVLEAFDDLQRANTFGLAFRKYGRGAVLAAYAPELPAEKAADRMVGYAVMRNNVSGNLAARLGKTYVKHQPPYAWLRSINVLPDYQGRGIGSALIAALAVTENFTPQQVSTAYVFEENERSLHYFETIGYKLDPVNGYEVNDYFGEGTKPVKQLRLTAPLQAVAQSAAARSLQLSKDQGITITFGKHME